MKNASAGVIVALSGLAMGLPALAAEPATKSGPVHSPMFSDPMVIDGSRDGATHSSQLWVRFKAGATVEQMTASMKSVGSEVVVWQSQLVPGLMAIEVAVGGVPAAVVALNKDPLVSYAEVIYYQHALAQETPYGIPMVGAPVTWSQGKGAGAVVAVLDTGVDLTHPDLPTVYLAETFIPGQAVDDLHTHGTHCSGTVLGLDNDIGVVGVAPEASLMIGKVLSNGGSSVGPSVNQGIEWAVLNGADVISMSLGGGSFSQASFDVSQAAVDAGVVVVASAGNGSTDVPSYPGSYEPIICVAAIDSNQNQASFSNYGPTIDITGPGVNVYSTVPTIAATATWSGTARNGTALTGSALGTATGQAIYCGLGLDPADFPASVNGNIAHIRRGSGTFAEKTENALDAGAIGVIISNNASGGFSGTLNGNYPVVVLGISQADGNTLEAASGVSTTVTVGQSGHGYGYKSGTSMSCPHVAGVAGLIIGNMLPRRFSPLEIRAALELSAQDLGDPGRDDIHGWGNVQAPGALAYLQSIPGDCAGDWDGDDDADSDDVVAFFAAFDAGDADADGDDDTDSDDVIAFFTSWDAGC